MTCNPYSIATVELVAPKPMTFSSHIGGHHIIIRSKNDMLKLYRFGIKYPMAFVASTIPIESTRFTQVQHDLQWHEVMADEYNALLFNST